MSQDLSRQSAWKLVEGSARLGQAIIAAGEHLNISGGIEGAVEEYAAKGADVDQAHRHLEQKRLALLYPAVPATHTL